MKILVTGARGLLGTELVRVLAKNHAVIPLTRAEADLTDEQATHATITRAEPEYVIHAAAWTNVDACEAHPPRAYAENAEATRHVALACRELGIPMLYVSTDYVFDGRKGAPYNEGDPAGPVNVYGASKLGGERHLQELVPRGCILRSAWLFGLGRENFLENILVQGERGRALRVVSDQVGSPTYAVDLAERLAELVGRGATGLYHVANAGAVSRYEVAQWVAQQLGWAAEQLEPLAGGSLPGRAKRPAYSALANERLLAEGLAPLRPWQAGVSAYLEARTAARGGRR